MFVAFRSSHDGADRSRWPHRLRRYGEAIASAVVVLAVRSRSLQQKPAPQDSLDKNAEIRYFTRVKPAVERHSATALVRDLASRGRYHFSTEEAAHDLGVSLTAARSALRRLKKKGLVASPYRGFHVIVPPEYQGLGCLPADQFIPQLMGRLDAPYYAGLLTAARYHGAAHHQPQVFQVVVPKNRPRIQCGRVAVGFVARHNAAQMPVVRMNTLRGYLEVSSPEATAFDLVGYAEHCGGLDNVATVLAELGEKLDADRMRSIARLSPLPWTQRLGFLLDQGGWSERSGALAAFVAAEVSETALLSPSDAKEGSRREARWKLLVNTGLESDLDSR